MIVICKQEQCEYNKNGRCAQKVLIMEKSALGFSQPVCKYWHWERPRQLYSRELGPTDEIVIEEGRRAQ